VLIAGATGLVGRELLSQLLASAQVAARLLAFDASGHRARRAARYGRALEVL
jgi:uncharacterized protein YbjT (DUF2867 family)